MNINDNLRLVNEMISEYELPLAEQVMSEYSDPFHVLVSAMLSTRTRDEVTLKACNNLFKLVKKPSDLKKLSEERIMELIKPVGYYRVKARHLKELSNIKKIPDSREELMKIKGVGLKVANLVLSVAFNKNEICVDTHVHRILNRWGYVNTRTPEQTHAELIKKLPRKYWRTINKSLVLFGQHICTPLKPHCSECLIRNCPTRRMPAKNQTRQSH